jgi:hypothetical protein
MVASLIKLQSRQCADENTTKVLVATRNRIDTLMLIHQKLYSENEELLLNKPGVLFLKKGHPLRESGICGHIMA